MLLQIIMHFSDDVIETFDIPYSLNYLTICSAIYKQTSEVVCLAPSNLVIRNAEVRIFLNCTHAYYSACVARNRAHFARCLW